ncbi:hypothetical protein BDY19DRAFT_440254 [Irpex rosettiformis]|uniref:Uncharacterized protein n=1 Tax=Irpex rosettiformis TaxID=378272 RepID=A0ACB8TUJ0_9APHY|nr:hypothetical protein BDY19DRAFT_440254 [Irpex rosettiformis]
MNEKCVRLLIWLCMQRASKLPVVFSTMFRITLDAFEPWIKKYANHHIMLANICAYFSTLLFHAQQPRTSWPCTHTTRQRNRRMRARVRRPLRTSQSNNAKQTLLNALFNDARPVYLIRLRGSPPPPLVSLILSLQCLQSIVFSPYFLLRNSQLPL